MRFVLALVFSLSLMVSACASTPQTQGQLVPPETVTYVFMRGATEANIGDLLVKADILVIQDGKGGSVTGMLNSIEYLKNNSHKHIIIDGPCYSACTLLLSAPEQVSFTENTTFLFHSSSVIRCKGSVPFRLRSQNGNKRMLGVFIPKQQEWIKLKNAFGSLDFVTMTFDEASQLYPEMVIDSSQLPKLPEGTETLFVESGSNFSCN